MAENNDGKVTLAVVKRDVEAIYEIVGEVKETLNGFVTEQRGVNKQVQDNIASVKIAGTTQHERIGANTKEIERLRSRSDKVDAANFVGTVIGSIFAGLVGLFGRQG